MSNNLKEILEEVKSDLSKYDDAGLLDEISMTKDAIRALKKLGNNVTILYDTVIEVKEGFAKMPANFRSMYAAYLCEPLGYTVNEDVEEHTLQGSHFYTERTVYGNTWNECSADCNTITENTIRENFYFKGKPAADFYYKQPTLLSLGKTFHKNACHKDCRNKVVRDNPNEIVIIDQTLQANFQEGYIYMMYYGLPMDEDGNITIPETENDSVSEYIEYAVKENMAERLIGQGDAQPGLREVYRIYVSKHRAARIAAKNELTMKKLTPRSMMRWANLNKLDSLKYESALTNKSGTSHSSNRK